MTDTNEKAATAIEQTAADATSDGDTAGKEMKAADPNDIMSFLDEISKYPTGEEETSATISKERNNKDETHKSEISAIAPQQQQQQNNTNGSGGGWRSWGSSIWSQASAAVKQTTDQLNRSVASSELLESRVKQIQNLVNKENIEKLGTGIKQLTVTLLETVAPPIAEHEIVEVWLSYDMVGYTGLEALVYRSFARVMEHTESGQVVVHNPNIDEHNVKQDDTSYRELNMCDSMLDGIKLAKANIDHLISKHFKMPSTNDAQSSSIADADATSTTYTPQSGAVPVIHCPVFMAIQPVKLSLFCTSSTQEGEERNQHTNDDQFVFVILIKDPTHQLDFKTYSQSMPMSWLDIPYEENEWVEDKMVEILRMAVTTIAQDYVYLRMSGNGTPSATTMNNVSSSTPEPLSRKETVDVKKDSREIEEDIQDI
ncbi:hypothetical protein BDF20DRAFT_891450 [Mycotypha africana]|uniref:uncharacterized protein n=1 Tax=Mycotypha africana TaxID=64632 RepID=UPI002301A2AF|nr:uncharacterized protein BDF20DRAFT_891450 [Mycotypha africana]KAI8970459.1 hypothetical protein BDF20DRAFT_891450 [Mycotypha africana]